MVASRQPRGSSLRQPRGGCGSLPLGDRRSLVARLRCGRTGLRVAQRTPQACTRYATGRHRWPAMTPQLRLAPCVCSRRQWVQLGFQQKDPASDLRGAGTHLVRVRARVRVRVRVRDRASDLRGAGTHARTMPAACTHHARTIHAPCTHACTHHARSMHAACTHHARTMPAPCTHRARTMHAACTQPRAPQPAACSLQPAACAPPYGCRHRGRAPPHQLPPLPSRGVPRGHRRRPRPLRRPRQVRARVRVRSGLG